MTLTDSSGLDLKGRGIQELDEVSTQHRDLEALILDNNQIEDLQGIQQFQNVKQLSLINNQVEIISSFILSPFFFTEVLYDRFRLEIY